jgi:nucleoside 2-deoxyribosyltransferase
MLKGYLASPLFTIGERYLNEEIAKILRGSIKDLELHVPQENENINDKTQHASSMEVAEADLKPLSDSNFVIAVLDGSEIDSGVSAEIGVAHALGIPVIALFSDIRQEGNKNKDKIQALVYDSTESSFAYRNLFTIGLIKLGNGIIVKTLEELEYAVRLMFEANEYADDIKEYIETKRVILNEEK